MEWDLPQASHEGRRLMHYVVKLRTRYYAHHPNHNKWVMWQDGARKFSTLKAAKTKRDILRKEDPDHRVVIVKSRADLRREREALRAVHRAALAVATCQATIGWDIFEAKECALVPVELYKALNAAMQAAGAGPGANGAAAKALAHARSLSAVCDFDTDEKVSELLAAGRGDSKPITKRRPNVVDPTPPPSKPVGPAAVCKRCNDTHGVPARDGYGIAEACPVHRDACSVHGYVHGAEVEELRGGIEQILAQRGDYDDSGLREDLQRLLDRVDARDSLAFLEKEAPRARKKREAAK